MTGGSFDVVVVGGGASGLAAALAAAEEGASVALLEKNPSLGGTSALAIGSFTASETALQREAGIDDSHDAHFADFDLFRKPALAQDNLELRRLYVDSAADTLHWLMSLGLAFSGPSPEPPHGRPRLHTVLPHAGAYIHRLASACRARRVEFALGTPARSLVARDGRVTAVEARRSKRTVWFRAAKGVVLATGDYAAGKAMLREFAGERVAALGALNRTNTGDGYAMARDLGARVLNGHVVEAAMRFAVPERVNWLRRLPPTALVGRAVRWAMRSLPRALLEPAVAMYLTVNLEPSARLYQAGAILVNLRGERYTDESAAPIFDTAKQEGGCAFLVVDGAIARRFERWPDFVSTAPGIAYAYLSDYRRHRPDICREATTIDALARSIGVPADALAASVASAPQLAEPPYVALGPLHAWIMTCDGSLAVSPRFEVLRGPDAAGGTMAPIPGLYAVGSLGQGGLLLPGHGQHLGWAFTSGQLCGRHVARLPGAGAPGPRG